MSPGRRSRTSKFTPMQRVHGSSPYVDLLDRGAEVTRRDLVTGADLARYLHQDEGHPAAAALLVALDECQHVIHAGPAKESSRPRASSSAATSRRRASRPEGEAPQQPDAHASSCL